ncbi:MAG: DNA double-strand break repair nuclease NurA [Methanobrevibacter sp.]|uniref:DNA double-strand break repair nuclease NurA n=1 Tax=Methanobrevibacter sp. TaxID=66852 RepID=UPI0025DDF6DF|nr:DNA double-strand break repair nuclease NurA [Methanobrevibacter sp.]MBR0272257.1 DNA double-strand break repair nuclease NurA [Methanobrevibacter sp.]
MLKSLYIKALNNRIYLKPEPEKNEDFTLKDKWFDKPFAKSKKDFSIAAGDGSFNIKKFLMFNYCPVSAEALIYDGNLINIEQSEIFEMDHVPFLREIIPNYMSIFELKCCLKAINEYDVDYYLFDGSILGDLQNHYPKGAKQPSDMKNLDKGVIKLFEDDINDLSSLDLSFPNVKRNVFAHVSGEGGDEFKDYERDDVYNLYLSSIEKLLVLKEVLKKNRKIISISKTSSNNDLFHSKAPDIGILDQLTEKQGISKIIHKKVKDSTAVPFPVYNEFFNELWFTIFYVRLKENKNILKVELPYYVDKDDDLITEIVEIIKRDSAEGYPYLLNKAHNDVVITNKHVEELLKISRIYETTNREQLKR